MRWHRLPRELHAGGKQTQGGPDRCSLPHKALPVEGKPPDDGIGRLVVQFKHHALPGANPVAGDTGDGNEVRHEYDERTVPGLIAQKSAQGGQVGLAVPGVFEKGCSGRNLPFLRR